jgi:hypothetical protein
VLAANFEATLKPLAALALSPKDAKNVRFDLFFSQLTAHELGHRLGPSAGGDLREYGAPLEEAKADLIGLFLLSYLFEHGGIPGFDFTKSGWEIPLFSTYVISMLRIMRVGLANPHAKGAVLQLHELIRAGAISIEKSGKWKINEPAFQTTLPSLTGRILTLLASGNLKATKKLFDQTVFLNRQEHDLITRTADLPIDVDFLPPTR